MNDPEAILHEKFDKCVRVSRDGRRIQCKLGLWSVDAPTPEMAHQGAWHYWTQYWLDGEYDSLLMNDKADDQCQIEQIP